MIKSRIGKFIWSSSATAAVEFAFIAPILLALIAGTVEVGRAFQVYNATNRLATQYAIAWADCSDVPTGACNDELSNFNTASSTINIAPQLQTILLSITMFQVVMQGTTPTVVYASPPGTVLTPAQVSAAQAVLTVGQSGVIVSANYNHSLQFFSSLMTPALASYLAASYTVVQLKE